VYAAAATASRLLGLSSKACVHALGIAGTMPAGLMAAQYGAMVKRLFVGHAAWAGMMAAMLAKDGLTGIENIFDVEYGGYPKAVSDEISLPSLTLDLGKRFEAATIGYKLFACSGTNHTTLQAVSQLMRENEFEWQDVEAVNVVTSKYQVLHSGWEYKPASVMAAQMSIQYCVAVLLMQGKVFIEQFKKKYLADPKVLSLVKRVKVIADPDQSDKDRMSKVEIKLADGRCLKASCNAAKGHPQNPPSWEDMQQKFMVLATKVISTRRCERIVKIVTDLEKAKDMSELASLMTPPRRSR
jgi:aconitate decarboxylase